MIKAGLTIITTTHDLLRIAGRLPWVVCTGVTVIAEGPPPEVLSDANPSKIYGLPMLIVVRIMVIVPMTKLLHRNYLVNDINKGITESWL